MPSFETSLRTMAELDPAMRLIASTHRYPVEQGEVIVQFSGDGLDLQDCITALLCDNPIPIISKISSKVRLTLEGSGPTKLRLSAEFTPTQCLAILGGEPPNQKNFGHIKKSIQDQTA